MNLALIGAPASGKGTQAKALVKHFKIPHISTGDILRAEIEKESEIGKEVKNILAEGKLVSDDLIVRIVQERLKEADCANGFILDGFPRTLTQAEKLGEMVELKGVIYMNTPDDLILSRITARENCPQCGATYNKLYLPAKKAGECDGCHVELVQRKDDTAEAGKERLKTFYAQSTPLIEYYREKGNLIEIDGTIGLENIEKSIIESLES